MSDKVTKAQLAEQLRTANELNEAHQKTIDTLQERVRTLASQRDALQMRGNAADATSEGVRTALIETQEELEEQKRRAQTAYKARDRAHKRAVAANNSNDELRKALRESEHKRRVLQLRIDHDEYSHRRVTVLEEQLRLVREAASVGLGIRS